LPCHLTPTPAAWAEVFVDPTRHLMPLPVRVILRLNRVNEFLRMRAA
jgi:hypothetical protein